MIIVTRLGYFRKVLVTILIKKVAHKFGKLWAILKKHFLSKNLLWILFGQHLEKIGLLLTPTSGHTGDDDVSKYRTDSEE